MCGLERVEKLPRGPDLSFFRVLKALPDAFLGVGMGGYIEQTLIGFSVLHDGGCFPLDCEHDGELAFFTRQIEWFGALNFPERDIMST